MRKIALEGPDLLRHPGISWWSWVHSLWPLFWGWWIFFLDSLLVTSNLWVPGTNDLSNDLVILVGFFFSGIIREMSSSFCVFSIESWGIYLLETWHRYSRWRHISIRGYIGWQKKTCYGQVAFSRYLSKWDELERKRSQELITHVYTCVFYVVCTCIYLFTKLDSIISTLFLQ